MTRAIRVALEGDNCLTHREIGELLNISHSRVQQIEVVALRKLRKAAMKLGLDSFCDLDPEKHGPLPFLRTSKPRPPPTKGAKRSTTRTDRIAAGLCPVCGEKPGPERAGKQTCADCGPRPTSKRRAKGLPPRATP